MALIETKQAAPGYKIKRATWRDLNDLYTLEHQCFNSEAWSLLDLVGVLTLPATSRLKAIAEEKMVGFIAGEIKKGEQLGWVTTVGVIPEYRHLGIGRALLRASEKEMKMPRVCLCVRKSNLGAIKLYESEGYRGIDEWRRYYEDGEDAIIMEKLIVGAALNFIPKNEKQPPKKD